MNPPPFHPPTLLQIWTIMTENNNRGLERMKMFPDREVSPAGCQRRNVGNASSQQQRADYTFMQQGSTALTTENNNRGLERMKMFPDREVSPAGCQRRNVGNASSQQQRADYTFMQQGSTALT
ncbi:hypothetical protein PAMP_015408 [Pampus punctatissimus]